jgi:aspartyl-tRNA(Asn)/glutamyl-tRNA(Gln) amidotransferase subunit A
VSPDLIYLTAADLLDGYARRAFSPIDVVRQIVDRYRDVDPTYNAFVVFDADSALEQARASEARWLRGEPAGLADGIPTTVKDLVPARGWPTRRGSLAVAPQPPWEEDGAPVARLREHGAIILGKTTTPEFGWKGVTDSPLTGITRNPWNPAMTPGGSSGGAAAAAALGLGPWHVATDGGGSVRIPAAFCGLFGFKPTWGVVPVHPHSAAGTLWHQGPIARTVDDAATLLGIIAGPDRRDWYRVPHAIDFPSRAEGIRGWRIGYSRDLGYADVDPAVAAAVDDGVRVLEELGAVVEALDPGFPDPIDVMQPMWSVALALAMEQLPADRRHLVERPLAELAEGARGTTAVDYRRLEQRREVYARSMCALHDRYDLLVTPQMPITAFEVGHEVPPGTHRRRWWEWSPFTYPFNLTQQPCATVPCGLAADGLPVALQFVGAKFDDARVLRAARSYESARAFRLPAIARAGVPAQGGTP